MIETPMKCDDRQRLSVIIEIDQENQNVIIENSHRQISKPSRSLLEVYVRLSLPSLETIAILEIIAELHCNGIALRE